MESGEYNPLAPFIGAGGRCILFPAMPGMLGTKVVQLLRLGGHAVHGVICGLCEPLKKYSRCNLTAGVCDCAQFPAIPLMPEICLDFAQRNSEGGRLASLNGLGVSLLC